MSNQAISARDLAFVRDVLIPRCAWLEGPEIEAVVRLRLRIDAIFAALPQPAATDAAAGPGAP